MQIKKLLLIPIMALFLGASCANTTTTQISTADDTTIMPGGERVSSGETATAVFASGCFWCTESDFEKLPGVLAVTSGYAGGAEANPTYQDVSAGKTGHRESVLVEYDTGLLTYTDLLDYFWHHVDPTDDGGQFVDRGDQYRPAIFTQDYVQQLLAIQSLLDIADAGIFESPITLEILPLTHFYPAEDYHQDYYKTHPDNYTRYRSGSGRDQFLERTWRDKTFHLMTTTPANPNQDELKGKLTDLQYKVTQEGATERPFDNEYHDKKDDGIYVDVVSGKPLFSSKDKFDSGSGWPSFTKPIGEREVKMIEDNTHGMQRVEVKGADSASHLGHVFPDGPQDQGGLRYCINSAALKFIPKEKLEEMGYGEYADQF